MSHRSRRPLASRHPVHVTVRLKEGLPLLRRRSEHAALLQAFRAGRDRFGFRLIHYSIQSNHLHLIVEAKDRRALSRGLQGLLVRVAKVLNRLWGRKGSLFADRYHDRILKTPRQVRNALVYVLHNARKHGRRLRQKLDAYASIHWFDGWRERVLKLARAIERPVAMARTWLLTTGWRRHGLISVHERPAAPG